VRTVTARLARRARSRSRRRRGWNAMPSMLSVTLQDFKGILHEQPGRHRVRRHARRDPSRKLFPDEEGTERSEAPAVAFDWQRRHSRRISARARVQSHARFGMSARATPSVPRLRRAGDTQRSVTRRLRCARAWTTSPGANGSVELGKIGRGDQWLSGLPSSLVFAIALLSKWASVRAPHAIIKAFGQVGAPVRP
jgi:hypothetical protein